MASLLEALLNQHTAEIKEKEAEIKDLWTQLEGADEAKVRRLEQRIQALEGQRDKLVETRKDLLQGAFLDSSGSTLTATTPVASCIYPGSLLSLHGALQ